MTAEILNLRTARKQKARAERAAEAAENRVKFGQTRTEREARSQRQDLAKKRLDGHRLQSDDDGAV